MALIECPECKAQISDQAAACPQCGCPVGTEDPAAAAPPATAAPEPEDSAPSLTAETAAAEKKQASKTAMGCVVMLLLGLAFCVYVLSTDDPGSGSSSAPSVSDTACRQDLNCWGNRHISTGVYCEDRIERLAQYSHQWTDGFLEPKFSRFRWKDQSAGTLTLIGDKIQFQNGLGAWQNHTYQCDIDPETNTVLGVRASPGRLPG